MATIGASFLNLIDMFRAGGDAATANVAEVLRRSSPAVKDAIAVEANSGTVHSSYLPPRGGDAPFHLAKDPD